MEMTDAQMIKVKELISELYNAGISKDRIEENEE